MLSKMRVKKAGLVITIAAAVVIGLGWYNSRTSEDNLKTHIGASELPSSVAGEVKPLMSSASTAKRGVTRSEIPLAESHDRLVDFEMGDYEEYISPSGKLKITVFGANAVTPPGTPDLPVVSYVMDGVKGQQAKAVLLDARQEIREVEEVALREAPPNYLNAMMLQEDDWFPKEVVDVQQAMQGDKNWVRVAYHPVQYNPVQKKLRINRDVKARIAFTPVGEKKSAGMSVAALSVVQESGISNLPVCVPIAGELFPEVQGNPADFASRQSGAEIQANWKFPISAVGVYRITQPVMLASGITNPLVGDDFRLFSRSNEVAIKVSTSGVFGPSDYIEFFGVPHDGYYSTNNVYWLGFGSGGKRVATRDVTPQLSGPLTTSYIARSTVNSNNLYRSAYEPNRDFDHWMMTIVTEPSNISFPLSTPDRLVGQTASLSFSVHELESGGTSIFPKDTRLIFGATTVTQILVTGQAHAEGDIEFSSSLLTDGTSSLVVDQVPSSGIPSACYPEFFTVDYPRTLRALSDELCFALPPGSDDALVDGFSVSNGTHILDVTDVWCPVQLTNIQRGAAASGIGLRFDDERLADRGYYAYAESTIVNVPALEEVCFRNLADTDRSAEYILICPYDFREQGYRLLKHRVQGDLEVVVAPIEDVINEFGYGVYDAVAVRQFLGYAWHHWASTTNLKYCLMAGEGSADPFDNRGFGVSEIIPVVLGPTTWRWTAQDNQYGMVNGDDLLPEIAIGRIPVASTSLFHAVVDKTISRELADTNGFWRNQLLLLADDSEPGLPFKTDTENTILTNAVTGGYSQAFDITELYRENIGSAASMRTQINSAINGGVDFISYIGHGSLTDWTDDPVYTPADVSALSNSEYPVLAIFSCQNGAYQDPELAATCLAESFLTEAGKGVSACFAPAMLSDQIQAANLADGFSASLLIDKDPRLGDAVLDGFLHLWGTSPFADALLSYEIFGDPALVVHP